MSQSLPAPHSLQRKALTVGGALDPARVLPRSSVVSSRQDQGGGAAAFEEALPSNPHNGRGAQATLVDTGFAHASPFKSATGLAPLERAWLITKAVYPLSTSL